MDFFNYIAKVGNSEKISARIIFILRIYYFDAYAGRRSLQSCREG